MTKRVDELVDGYIQHLESQNDQLTLRYNIDVEIYNLLHDFIERQYTTECEFFYDDYPVLMEELEAIDPTLVSSREVRSDGPPAGPPVLRVVPREPETKQ